jgi:putative ABC transport system permease protein
MSLMKRLFGRRQRDRELDEEVQAHLRMAAQERLEQGEFTEDARAGAVREFGNVALVIAFTREVRGWGWLEILLEDVRYGARMLRKNPGFTAVAVLTLALGIGANTAIFSVVNATLLEPLPFNHPARIMWVRERNHGAVAPVNFLEWRRQNYVFSDLSAYISWGANLVAQGQAQRVTRTICSADMFRLLEVRPQLGRDFLHSDEAAGHVPVVILSHSLWQQSLGGNPNIVGKPVTIDDRRFAVVGVMPAGFRYPGTSDLWTTPEREVPEAPIDIGDVTQSGVHYLTVIGRLAPDVTLDRARAQMDTIADRLATQNHAGPRERGVIVEPLKKILVGDVRPLLLILLSAVGLVLLIACANVANLTLTRARARRAETAVRSALGASRLRLVRQVLTESLLVALAGGALGLLLAFVATRLLLTIGSETIPNVREVHMDSVVLGFTLATTMLTGILFGLAPALGLRRVNVGESLKQGGCQASASRELLRGTLVVSEIALALVLLTSAGLLLRSFVRLSGQARLGFNPQHVLALSVAPTSQSYKSSGRLALFYRQALERLRALPGVTQAGLVNCVPPYSESTSGITIAEHHEHEDEHLPTGAFSTASPDYFQTMQIPVGHGRVFSAGDSADAPKVAVINQTLARLFFAGQDPIGKHVQWSGPSANSQAVWLEIVGVVGDVKNFQPGAPPMPQVYASFQQENWEAGMTFVVRTASDSAGTAVAARAAIQAADPNMPVFDVKSLAQSLGQSLSQPRFNLLLFVLFAALAVVLAAIGIYGVVSYSVARRTHEIGIRMALGATRRPVLRLLVGQGMSLTLVGLGLGLACAFALTRFLASLLYGVTPTDPATLALVCVLLAAVSLVASYIPARRATKVDPMEALRYE